MLGGIGIVFDSELQFKSMIQESFIDIGKFIHQESKSRLYWYFSIRLDEIRPLQEYIIGEGTIVESVIFPEDKKNT